MNATASRVTLVMVLTAHVSWKREGGELSEMSELWIVFREIELQSIYGSNNLVAMELTTVLYIKKRDTKRKKQKIPFIFVKWRKMSDIY